MTDFKFITRIFEEQVIGEVKYSERAFKLISLEIAYQLRRIADILDYKLKK